MKKKTQEDFVKDVFNKYGNEYTVLGTYLGTHKKVKVKHNVCGKEFEITPSSLLSGRGCRDCGYKRNGDNRRYTQEEFEKKLFEKYGNEYQVVGKYINSQTKIKVKHLTCGRILDMLPASLLHGIGCTHCKHREGRLITNDDFKKHLKEVVGDEYIPLTEYTGATNKVVFKHKVCGNVFEMRPNNIFNGQRCPHCAGNAKKTDEEFQQEVFSLVKNDYTFLEPYVDRKTKLRVRHNECGSIYEVRPSDFIRGNRCPYCFGSIKKTNTQFKKEIYDLVVNEYTFLEPYVNYKTKIKVRHNKCGNIYEVTPSDFLNGKRCPYCNSPKGETVITKLLDTLNINYEYQKTFPDLKDKTCLSYDFYIPSQSILIEYQGVQHYQPIDYFGGETAFRKQQKHDQMKLDYAKEHGYNLITVPYTEDTFSKIKKYLIKHGL